MPYTLLVSLHVIVAVLGLGPLPALALLTKRPPVPAGAPRPLPPEAALRAYGRVLCVSQIGLGLMLVTGGILVAMTHGAFAHQAWMAISVVLFLVAGAGTGLAQSQRRKALAQAGSIAHVEHAHQLLLATCGVVAVIVWLMQAKPF